MSENLTMAFLWVLMVGPAYWLIDRYEHKWWRQLYFVFISVLFAAIGYTTWMKHGFNQLVIMDIIIVAGSIYAVGGK